MQVRTPICSKNKRKSTPKRFKIEPKSVQNRLPGRPRSLRGPECRPRAPESAPRGGPSDPKGALGGPQGRPKRDQGRPKSAQRGPEGSPGTPRERQNRPQVDFRSEKSQICEKCSATRPCRRSGHFAPPQIDPKSAQNRPKSVPRAPTRPCTEAMKGARAETSPCARAGKGARARNGALCEKGQGMN